MQADPGDQIDRTAEDLRQLVGEVVDLPSESAAGAIS
jgi:hypothetical protein